MSVYIELVILDNATITIMLILLTNRILSRKPNKLKTVIATLLSTGVSLCYPYVYDAFLSVAIRLILYVVMCIILFCGRERFILSSIIFLLVTFLFGGAIFAVGFLVQGSADKALTASVTDLPVSVIMLSAFTLYVILKRIILGVKKVRKLSINVYECALTLLGIELKVRALMDTGNRLYDTKSGLPVVILSAKSIINKLTDEQVQSLVCGRGDLLQRGARYIQISTVGGSNKILLLKPDEFRLYFDDGRNIIYDVTVGLTFSPLKDSERYDVILHPSLIE
jgi:sigma-E processing peptidase SpoIIGA